MKVNSDPWPFYLRSFGFKACHPWEYRNSGPCILKFTEHRWKRCSSYVLLCDGHLTSPSWDENPHVSHVLLVWTCLHFETIHRMRTSALLMVTWYRTSTTSGRHRRRDSCYGAGWKDNMPCNGHSSDPGQCSVTDEVWSLMQVDSHCSYPPMDPAEGPAKKCFRLGFYSRRCLYNSGEHGLHLTGRRSQIPSFEMGELIWIDVNENWSDLAVDNK